MEFIEGTKDKVLRKIFSKHGYIKHIVKLSAATAIIKFNHPETAKIIFSNLIGILQKKINN